MRVCVIIHGWSDQGKSFKPLAKRLAKACGYRMKFIHLADYVSLEDQVSFDDLAAAMQRPALRVEIPRAPLSDYAAGGGIIRYDTT